MIKTLCLNTFKVIRYILGLVFLIVFFYITLALLLNPLNTFLEKNIEFIYGLF
jgi:hypothetical protein